MTSDIKVPTLGESVTSATIARWIRKAGDRVAADEPVVELETDKVTVEVGAPAAGILTAIHIGEGEEVEVGTVLGVVDPVGAMADAIAGAIATAPMPPRAVAPAPHAPLPAAAKLMTEQKITPAQIGTGTGKDHRVTKGDVLDFLTRAPTPAPAKAAPSPRRAAEGEERVKMTRLRRTIAARLKEAQNTAAMLTTFNEVDMSAVMALRAEYREAFEKKHQGARLGFMSFFVRACVAGLQEFPAVNAEIDGEDIVYKNFVHMGIAVGGPSGLVVPVLRHAEQMNFAQIEAAIADFGRRVRDGQLKLDELTGGTFSITNGGTYGSLMSTPILNPPQSAILGMHKIQDRAMVIAGKVEVRPMMYLAVSYDHRIIDGKEAVSFLVRVKECIEDPRRLLLDL